MNQLNEAEAFRRGFLTKMAELSTPGTTKEAAGLMGRGVASALGRELAPAAKATWSAGKNLLTKAPSAVAPLTESAAAAAGTAARPLTAAPSLLSRAGRIATHPATLGVGGTAAGATGMGLYAGNKYKSEATNLVHGFQNAQQEFMKSQGGNSWMGRLMMLLSFLFGGQNYVNRLRNNFQQFATAPGTNYFSPTNRQILSQVPPAPVQ